MGAMVTIRYDGSRVTDKEATTLANIIQKLVLETIEANDVFVYADKVLIAVGADPIEVFVQVNANKTPDPAALIDTITEKLAGWKRQTSFVHPINLNVIPVEWHAKFGI
jgi:hypothetical protein